MKLVPQVSVHNETSNSPGYRKLYEMNWSQDRCACPERKTKNKTEAYIYVSVIYESGQEIEVSLHFNGRKLCATEGTTCKTT